MIGGIRETLSLEHNGIPKVVDFAALAGDGPIEEVAAVELQARLSGINLHHPARGWLIHTAGECALNYRFCSAPNCGHIPCRTSTDHPHHLFEHQ